MSKKRNLLILSLLILGILLITGCTPKLPVLVTFDSQGGSAVDSQIVSDDEKATKPTTPTKEGYTFGGWYKESGCTNVWDFDTDTVTSDVTLFLPSGHLFMPFAIPVLQGAGFSTLKRVVTPTVGCIWKRLLMIKAQEPGELLIILSREQTELKSVPVNKIRLIS